MSDVPGSKYGYLSLVLVALLLVVGLGAATSAGAGWGPGPAEGVPTQQDPAGNLSEASDSGDERGVSFAGTEVEETPEATPTSNDSPPEETPDEQAPEGGTPEESSEETPNVTPEETPEETPETSAPETPPAEQTPTPEDTPDGQAPEETPDEQAPGEQTPDETSSEETPTPTPSDSDRVRSVDSCTTIDEAGEYELTADIEGETDGVCLAISASDVVLEGNGHAIEGSGAEGSTGVQVYDPDRSEIENVTIRDVRVENWGLGVEVGNFSDNHPVQATLENVAATENEGNGVFLVAADGSELDAVTADGNGVGIALWETSNVTADGITVSENERHGLNLWDIVGDSEFTDVTATDNAGQGIHMGTNVYRNTIADAYVANNDGSGIVFADDSRNNTVRETTVENNGDAGIFLFSADGDELHHVVVRGNDGWQLDGRDEPVSLTATRLGIGDAAEFAFAEESVALDAVERDALPALPENASAVGGGVDVDGIDESVEVTLEYDEAAVDGERVRLWHHDGNEWRSAAAVDADDADGRIEADLADDGVYAPVDAEEDDNDAEDEETPTSEETPQD